MPCEFRVSIVRQLYTEIPSYDRSGQVEADANIVNMPFVLSLMNHSKKVWRQGLELCFERDSNGVVISINDYWLDFIIKVIKDGLTIFGISVTQGIMLGYTKSIYNSAEFQLFSKHVDRLSDGLATRTLTLATVNPTLTNSIEFMSAADMELPILIKTTTQPKNHLGRMKKS